MEARGYLLAVLAICLSMGFYYNEDMLQTLEQNFKDHPYFLTPLQFNLLYFATYIAQFLLLLPLGILVDMAPLSVVMTGLVVLTIVSEVVMGVLVHTRGDGYIFGMCLARGVFGISGLGIVIIQGKLANRFAKQHYEYIMGLCLNIGYVFTAANSLITSRIAADSDDLSPCFFIGTGMCFLSLIFALLLVFLFIQPAAQASANNEGQQQKEEGFSFAVLKDFPVEFWVLVLGVFLSEGSINSFNDNLADLIITNYGFNIETVGLLIAGLYTALVPLSFLLGHIIEEFPAQKRNITVVAKALYLIMMIWMTNLKTTDSPSAYYYVIVGLFLLCMSFNWTVFHSIVEPITSYYVKEKHMGTAWGVIGSCLGFTQCIFAVINMITTSSSRSELKSYQSLEKVFIFMSVLSLLMALWVRCRDYALLDKTYEEKEKEERRLEEVLERQE